MTAMSVRLTRHPLLVAMLIAAAAEALFALYLGRPGMLVFDEVHYVPAARALLALEGPRNTEHPLLAKELIALGIALFGDGPVGWRALSSLAGAATVVGAYGFALALTRSVRTGAFAALFVAINQLVFVHARIATIEASLAAFLMLALAAMALGMRSPRRATAWWLAGSVALGLATAAKWAAAPYVAMAGAALLIIRWRDGHGLWRGTGQPHWPGLATLPALAILGVASIAAYFATFAPAFFYATDAMTLDRLIPFQRAMYAAQTQVLAPHPYQSDWWSWPLMLRPIWYFYEPVDGVMRGVLLVGNPAIMWGGLVAVVACLILGLRRRARVPLWTGGLYLAALGLWAVIPKSLGFYYYYQLPGLFVAIAIAIAFHHARPRWAAAEQGFALLAIGLFVYFYPILSGAPLTGQQAFTRWMWFDSWR